MSLLSADTLPLDPAQPELIVSAALYLMSSYGCSGGCPRLAQVILRHLRILAGRDDLAPVLRDTCAKLVEQWEVELYNTLPAASGASHKSAAKLFGFKRSMP